MFDVITDLKTLIASLKAGNYFQAARDLSVLFPKLLDLVEAFTKNRTAAFDPGAEAELDVLLADLTAAAKFPAQADPAGGEKAELDPATIITLVLTVIDLLRRWRDWRNRK